MPFYKVREGNQVLVLLPNTEVVVNDAAAVEGNGMISKSYTPLLVFLIIL